MTFKPVTVLAALTFLVAACGESTLSGVTGRKLEGDARPVPEEFALKQALGTSGQAVLFLNFDGQLVKYGNSSSKQNTSWIVPKELGSADIPAFDPSQYGVSRQDAIAQIVQMVQRDYRDYDVVVTTERPSSGDYTMVMIGGSPSLINEADQTAGISPLDEGNPNRNDLVFVFSNTLYDLRELATCVSHEAGHSFGLDHLEPTNAIMYPVLQPGDLEWLNGTIYGSSQTQNEPYILSKLFGSPTATPTPPPTDTSKDDAAFVSQEVPTTVAAGEQFIAALTFKNTGSTTWSGGSGYALSASDSTFGGDTLVLPFDLAPGQTKTISFFARAPNTPGTYAFRWTLSHDGAVFGTSSQTVSITVPGATQQQNRAPIGQFERADGNTGSGWAFDEDAPDSAIWIDVYVDGTYAGSVQADQKRTDLGSGVTGSYHGFLFGMPSLGGGTHKVQAYAVDDQGQTAYRLQGEFSVAQ